MLLAAQSFDTRPMSTVAERLDALGRIPLVTYDYRPIPGPKLEPRMQRVNVAFPTWTAEVIGEAQELDWDAFWAKHPAGAARIMPLAGISSFDDAVRAAKELALTTRPNLPPGDKQTQGVLLLADGTYHVTSLGGFVDGQQSAWVLRQGTYPGYWRPQVIAHVPELVAVVGGFSMVDLRGKTGVPVQS
jgi:hypothetical protein